MTDMLTPPTLAAHRWIDDHDGPLVCRQIVDVTHDVKSFVFERPDGASLTFLAGQYLTVRVDVDGVPMERCYTISSAPTRPVHVAITVKRIPGGPVSAWLHDNLAEGDHITASGPLGRFSHSVHAADKYLFLSAGSGITPTMSMVRTICDAPDDADVAFVHCARTPRDIIFREELDAISADARVAVAAVCEDDAPGEVWTGPRGRIGLPTLLTLVPDLLDREIFTCGPPAFMRAVNEMLDMVGIEPERRHEESFTLGGAPVITDRPVSGVTRRVEFLRSGRVVECDEDSTLLAAAAREGLAMPSSCGEGVCGTCKFSLVSGRVDMQHNGGIRPREVAEGKILLCSSRPTEDVVVDA